MSGFWETLDPRYRVVLCDIWGVIHDGVTLYPNAVERLRQWHREKRLVILITNAPRTADVVASQLERLGLPSDCWDGIATSGESGIAALNQRWEPVGFLGTPGDRAVLESRGVRIADDDNFDDLACAGLDGIRMNPSDYLPDLERWAGRDVVMHCLNPDRVVVRGGVPEACAGAIADEYVALGGTVRWYGKPHEGIYNYALQLAGDPLPGEVLAVGDSLRTDILGAARMGFDTVFVAGGIHAGEPFPADFGTDHGLGDWRPVAIVDGLA